LRSAPATDERIAQKIVVGRTLKVGRHMLSALFRTVFEVFHRESPQQRGMRLLAANLTAAQRRQHDQFRYFDVIGGSSGRRYRIRQGDAMNVDVLDEYGRRMYRLCFFPRGRLATGDVMLAQKLALEAFETDAVAIAHKLPASYGERP
jgi:hypothetical protein